jgi:hypothetical protein
MLSFVTIFNRISMVLFYVGLCGHASKLTVNMYDRKTKDMFIGSSNV